MLFFAILISFAKGPEFKFLDKRVIDYGKVKSGGFLMISVPFRNVGNAPLEILNIHKSCTCTEVEVPCRTIAPGAMGEITLKVDTKGKHGEQVLVISLDLNTDRGYEIIRVNVNYV